MQDHPNDRQPARSGVSRFITAPDGLKLHLRVHGEPGAALPVVCLPGLTRNTADFDILAAALASDATHPRQVFALDSRGRGLSDYDSNPANYNLAVELNDLLAVLTALEIGRAVFVGSSRGGLLTILLAVARPNAIAGAVLNDIGPVVEQLGLMRIKSYVGRTPEPRSYEDGAEVLRRLFGSQFPTESPAGWLAAAHRNWTSRHGRLVPAYDVQIAKTLDAVQPDQPLPALWKEFDALATHPVMVVRGANSDILSPATVEAMRAHCPSLVAVEVADQGHTPYLAEPDIIARIAAFIADCERRLSDR